MAGENNTLAGLVQMNDANLADIMVTDLLQDAPVLRKLVAVPASQGGTTHKYEKETVAAGVAFRDVNSGIANAAPKSTLVTVSCKYLDGSFFRDVAIARGYKGGAEAYMAKQTEKALKSMFQGLEQQIFQGTGLDASGFTGLPGRTTTDYVNDTMVVDAGGSGGRSVWLIRSTEDDLAVVAGNDGEISFQWDPNQVQRILTDVSTGAGYNAWNADMGGWFELQFGSNYTLGRIANLDGTSGNTLTDDMISDAISRFPASRKPNLIVMDRTSLKELQQSRTATTPTGAPAPFPADAFGIEIVETEQTSTAESAVVTSTTTTTV